MSEFTCAVRRPEPDQRHVSCVQQSVQADTRCCYHHDSAHALSICEAIGTNQYIAIARDGLRG
eukprot:4787094-Amphidinium_carterae.1